MSIHDLVAEQQPESFVFSPENEALIKKIIAKYPKGKQASAVMPLLDLAQRQNDNWIPMKAIEKIAELLGMARIRVLEVASFYTMYNLKPVGKYFLQLCGTTPCMLRGAYKLVDVCKKKISEDENEVSKDGKVSWTEVECLGACINAPMVQINDDYYEDLDANKLEKIIDQTIRGETPKSGSYRGRINSEPENNRKTLMELKNA